MRKFLFCLFIVAFCVSTSVSCTDNDDDGTENLPLVVEGYICSGEYPVVMVSSAVPVTEEESETSSLSNHLKHWAKVTVSDGTKEVTLMGKYDDRYMPPYIYTTVDIKGEAGKSYELHVEADGIQANATTTIPNPVLLDSIDADVSAEQPLGRQFYAIFQNSGQKNFYTLFYLVGKNSQQFSLSTMGVFDNTMINTGKVRYPVNISDNLMESRKSSIFDIRPQYFCIRLATVDSVSYKFWKDFQDTYTMSGNFLMPFTSHIHGNVDGALGYWSGMGISEKWVTIKE